jgi:hypothetical protein
MNASGIYPALAAGGSFGDALLFFCRKGSQPRVFISKRTLRKNTPDKVKRIKLMKRPSTDVIVPRSRIRAIPPSGIKASKMESRRITGSKQPP